MTTNVSIRSTSWKPWWRMTQLKVAMTPTWAQMGAYVSRSDGIHMQMDAIFFGFPFVMSFIFGINIFCTLRTTEFMLLIECWQAPRISWNIKQLCFRLSIIVINWLWILDWSSDLLGLNNLRLWLPFIWFSLLLIRFEFDRKLFANGIIYVQK